MEVKKKSKVTFFFLLAGTRFLNIATERERKIEEASSSILWIQFLRRQRCEYFYLELVKYYLMKREQKTFVLHRTHHKVCCPGQYVHDLHLSPLPKGIKGKHDHPLDEILWYFSLQMLLVTNRLLEKRQRRPIQENWD